MKITELGTPLEFIAEKLVGSKANRGLESTLWSCVSCSIVSFFWSTTGGKYAYFLPLR